MIVFYRIGIYLYAAGIYAASLFNAKAKKWVLGRKNWKKNTPKLESCIWMHCSSLGEFEQGRPLLEKIKEKYPAEKIVLSFFSPSGFEIRKNYPYADSVVYLPLDSPKNAAIFINKIKPKAAIFVKYDLWFCFLQTLQKKEIPHYLISATFPEKHFLFKKWASRLTTIVQHFTTIFVQNQSSFDLLQQKGFKNVQLTGDTRVERVLKIKEEPFENSVIASFLKGKKAFIIGSSWNKDVEIIHKSFQNGSIPEKIIIAPHEINAENLHHLGNLFGKRNIALYTEYNEETDAQKPILILNTIGILAFAYRYAQKVYIGGGFGKGIHNTLEPAVYQIPIFFGPTYSKFPEAVYWVKNQIGIVITDEFSFEQAYKKTQQLTADKREQLNLFFKFHSNASDLIIKKLEEDSVLS